MKTNHIIALVVLSLATLDPRFSAAFGQGTGFTYQGRLAANGAPFTGSAEFVPTLWDAPDGGTQLAGNAPVQVVVGVTNGLFVLPLDFGANFPGANRWLQLELRTAIGPFTLLTPRQPLTPAPYAITAGSLGGTLPAAQLSGTIPSANLAGTYSEAVTFDHAASTFVGVHLGDGGGLSNVNATTLGGLGNAAFWQAGGNAGTTPGAHFLGTLDNQPLELKVRNERGLRLEPASAAPDISSPSPNIVGGLASNEVATGVNGATIAGGGGTNWWGSTPPHRVSGDFSTIGGGVGNEVQGVVSTIAGGERGMISSNAYNAFLGGGALNAIHSPDSTLGGGRFNQILTNAGNSVIGGGWYNVIQNNAAYATVPGGANNQAAGSYSFAAGQYAQALHTGSFVWADSGGGAFASTAPNQFSVRAAGGVRLVTGSAGLAVNGRHTVTGGNVGIGTVSPQAPLHVVGNALLAGNVQLETSTYRNLSLTGGNSLGYLYGSFPRFADGIHLGYNYYADANGADRVFNTGGATSRLTLGYGFIQLSIGAVGAAPTLQRLLANSTGVTVNGTFNNSSDRAAKRDFAAVDPARILERVVQLPITEWSYKEDPATRHLGPMAQDFHAAFQIGTDDRHIAPLDEGGVALAAIQGLNQKVDGRNQELETRSQQLEEKLHQKETEIAELRQQNAELFRRLVKIEDRLK